MTVIDYNGDGKWGEDAILKRYEELCKRFKVNPIDLAPRTHTEGDRTWIYPVMEQIILGIKKGDAACRQIGVEFIEEDQKFFFGKILKANTAKALRQNSASLSKTECQRIRSRVHFLLTKGIIPHEFREYAKLAKKVGLKLSQRDLEAIDRTDPYVDEFCRYLADA